MDAKFDKLWTVVALYSANLAKLESYFLEFPSLYGPGLELAIEEICMRFEK